MKQLVTKYFRFQYEYPEQDKIIIGKKTINITDFEISEYSQEAINSFDETLSVFKKQEVEFICIRCKQDFIAARLLTEAGFVFIETLFNPYFKIDRLIESNIKLDVLDAHKNDLEHIHKIAKTSFTKGRFHFDERFDKKIGDNRYSLWVDNAFNNPKFSLLKVIMKDTIIGFFIVEYDENKSVYWHLTAIDKSFQGKGLGSEVWKMVMNKHFKDNYRLVKTAISSNNISALNLYTKLNFRFIKASNTFHKFLKS